MFKQLTQEYILKCCSNIILQVPPHQDFLLMEYEKNISNAIIEYLRSTNKENLEMIYCNKFKFKMIFNELNRVFNFKFEYLH